MRVRAAGGLLALILAALPAAAEVSFLPGTPEGGTPKVYLEADPTSPPNELRLHVKVEGVEDLYGVRFQLRYPDRIVRFEDEEVVEGELLAKGPAPDDDTTPPDDSTPPEFETYFLSRRLAPKHILVGLTRVGEEAGVTGSGTLLTLVFRARADMRGRGKFRWEENDLVDSRGWVIPGVDWVKGTAVVTPPASSSPFPQ